MKNIPKGGRGGVNAKMLYKIGKDVKIEFVLHVGPTVNGR